MGNKKIPIATLIPTIGILFVKKLSKWVFMGESYETRIDRWFISNLILLYQGAAVASIIIKIINL